MASCLFPYFLLRSLLPFQIQNFCLYVCMYIHTRLVIFIILPEGTKTKFGSPRMKKESLKFLAIISRPTVIMK